MTTDAEVVEDEMMLALELAWGLIANSYGGDWSLATPDWRSAAERWRDEQWHPLLSVWTKDQSDDPDESTEVFSGEVKGE